MKVVLPVSAFILVTGITLLSGLIHARMTNRWGPSGELLAVGERLQGVPKQFGNWKMGDSGSGTLSDAEIRQLEPFGFIVRTYVNQTTGQQMGVTVILGPVGPIGAHTPDVCYTGRDWKTYHERKEITVQSSGEARDRLWGLTLESTGLQGQMLRVYYGWTVGGEWAAPYDARITFAGNPYLYKIQLAAPLPAGDIALKGDPGPAFLKDFLPTLKPFLQKPEGN